MKSRILFFCVSLLTRGKKSRKLLLSHNAEGWRKAHTHQYSGTYEAVSLQEKTNSSSCTVLALFPCAVQTSETALAFLLCLMEEMDIFISLDRFLPPAVKPEVITQLRNEATSLRVHSGFSLCMSVAMKSFWKWVCRAQAARDQHRERVTALPAETHPSSPPVPKEPSSRILRRVCLFVQKYFVWGESRCNQTHVF